MNLEESQNFKDKLNSVITAAQRYESYTKQLANTRTELKEYIDIAKESNGKLIDVSKQAEELLKKAISLQDSLREDVATALSPELNKFNTTVVAAKKSQADSLKTFEKDLNEFARKIGDAVEGMEKLFQNEVSEKLTAKVKSINSIVDNCQKQYKASTVEYEKAMNLFLSSKDVYANQQAEAQKQIEKTVGKVAASIEAMQALIAQVKTETITLTRNNENKIAAKIDSLDNSITKALNDILTSNNNLKMATHQLKDTIETKIVPEFKNFKNGIEKISTKVDSSLTVLNSFPVEMEKLKQQVKLDINVASGKEDKIYDLINQYMSENNKSLNAITADVGKLQEHVLFLGNKLLQIEETQTEVLKSLEEVKKAVTKKKSFMGI